MSFHGVLEDGALLSAAIPVGLCKNHDLSGLGNVSVLPPSQFNSIILFFVAVTVEVYMHSAGFSEIISRTVL